MKKGKRKFFPVVAGVAAVACVAIFIVVSYLNPDYSAYEGKWEQEETFYTYDTSAKKYQQEESYLTSSFVIDKEGKFQYEEPFREKEHGSLKKYKNGFCYEGSYEGNSYRWVFSKEKDKLVVVAEDLNHENTREKYIYEKKNHLNKRMELSEGRAIKIVSDQGLENGEGYDVSKISISPIRSFGKGYIYSAVYRGENSFCDLYYVQKDSSDQKKWNIINRQRRKLISGDDMSMSAVMLDGKKIIWGDLNENVWETDSSNEEEDFYVKTLRLQLEGDKKVDISLCNQTAYVQILDDTQIKGYQLLDEEGKCVYEQKGKDLLQEFAGTSSQVKMNANAYRNSKDC